MTSCSVRGSSSIQMFLYIAPNFDTSLLKLKTFFFSGGMMMLSSRTVPRGQMKQKRTKDLSMILCDQSFTKSSWKNTSSSEVLGAVARKDLVGHGCSLPFPQNLRLSVWSWILKCFSKISYSFIINKYYVSGVFIPAYCFPLHF